MAAPLTFPALGTTWWVEIFDEIDDKRRDLLFKQVATLVDSIEVRFSRFQTNSLVGILNTKRTISSIDADLYQLITLGKELYTNTDGVFNFLLGEHLEALGYDTQYSFTPTTPPPSFPNPLTDIIINDNTISLTKGKIDLGGYGKGWAIDQVATFLLQNGVEEFLINAGGDMYGTSEGGEPIVIYLEHPLIPDTHLGSTTLYHQGFAASSPFKRQWKHQGTTFNHIVSTKDNPETPPEIAPDGVFVKASKTMTADAFATIGLIIPPTKLLELAPHHQLALAFFDNATNSITSNQAFTNLTKMAHNL